MCSRSYYRTNEQRTTQLVEYEPQYICSLLSSNQYTEHIIVSLLSEFCTSAACQGLTYVRYNCYLLLYMKALLWCGCQGQPAALPIALLAPGYPSSDMQCFIPSRSELSELELETSEECMVHWQVQPCDCEHGHQGFVTSHLPGVEKWCQPKLLS